MTVHRILHAAVAAVLAATLPSAVFLAQSRDRVAPPAPVVGTLTLSGTVVLNEGTPPTPVRRARVTLTTDGAFPAQLADTDTDGKFRLENLTAGTWHLLVEKPGFVPVSPGPGRATVRPTVVTLGPGSSPAVAIVMQRAAAMEGQVLNDKGEPAANIVVSAVRLMYGPYGKRPAVVRQAITDDLGRFRVNTLADGEYYLDAAPDPIQAVTGPPPSGDRQQGFARSYYPGTPRVEDARIVAVTPGQELTGLDFKLTAVRMASVKGSVIDSSGRTPASTGFRLQRVGAPPGDVRGLASGNGTFQFPVVPPGEYWLLGSAQASPAADLEYAAMRVNISGQDFSGLSLTTAKGAVVNGRVEVDGGGSVPSNLQVIAHETEFELPAPQPASAPSAPVPGTVGADGAFAFPSLFGSRLFRVSHLPEGWSLKSVVLDDADVTDSPVEFFGTPTPRALRVVLTNRTAAVGGTIELASGGPSAGRVVVFSQDPHRWQFRSRAITTVEAASDGRYAIAGLLPGNYFIVAVADLDDGAWTDPEVLSRLQAMASPLVVTEGQKITLALKIR